MSTMQLNIEHLLQNGIVGMWIGEELEPVKVPARNTELLQSMYRVWYDKLDIQAYVKKLDLLLSIGSPKAK